MGDFLLDLHTDKVNKKLFVSYFFVNKRHLFFAVYLQCRNTCFGLYASYATT